MEGVTERLQRDINDRGPTKPSSVEGQVTREQVKARESCSLLTTLTKFCSSMDKMRGQVKLAIEVDDTPKELKKILKSLSKEMLEADKGLKNTINAVVPQEVGEVLGETIMEESAWNQLDQWGKNNKDLKLFVEELKTTLEMDTVLSSTWGRYKGALKRYISWSSSTILLKGVKTWPCTSSTLIIYLRYLWKAKKSLAAMRMAVYAIKWHSGNNGFRDPTKNIIVAQIMKAAALKLFNGKNRKYALSKEQVKLVIKQLERFHSRGEKGMKVLIALLLTQFEGVSRIGELCRTRRKNLQELEGGRFRLLVKGKTHRFRGGDNKYFESSEGRYGAMKKVVEMLTEQNRWALPVDSAEWNKPLFQIDGEESFRSGACAAALAAGCTLDEVKRQGFWVSECVNLYFMPTLSSLTKTSRNLHIQ